MSSSARKTLHKLYERGSLRNTEAGFELAFKNTVAPSTLIEIEALIVDGDTYIGEQIVLRLERPKLGFGRPPAALERQADQVSAKRVLAFDLYTVARVIVPGQHLAPGPYKVAWYVKTKEAGDIIITAEDTVPG